jgi:hypothetical protein
MPMQIGRMAIWLLTATSLGAQTQSGGAAVETPARKSPVPTLVRSISDSPDLDPASPNFIPPPTHAFRGLWLSLWIWKSIRDRRKQPAEVRADNARIPKNRRW